MKSQTVATLGLSLEAGSLLLKRSDNKLRRQCQRALSKLKKTKRERDKEVSPPDNQKVVFLHAILIKRPQSTEHLGHPHKEANANIALAGR